MKKEEPHHCERCGEELTTVVWLELDWSTNIFSKEAVEPKYSQGSFPFGPSCAEQVLKAGGKLARIRKAKR